MEACIVALEVGQQSLHRGGAEGGSRASGRGGSRAGDGTSRGTLWGIPTHMDSHSRLHTLSESVSPFLAQRAIFSGVERLAPIACRLQQGLGDELGRRLQLRAVWLPGALMSVNP